jgi:hypothetical protein
MRETIKRQLELGGEFIGNIYIDPKSRDDIPMILKGLQRLYCDEQLRGEVFDLLDAQVSPSVRRDTGRPGMDLWSILVLAVLKQGLNCDYDRLAELASEHFTLREMLGHGTFMKRLKYDRQTVADNVRLMTPELLSHLSQLVVSAGHKAIGKEPGEAIQARCDSFVVETDVRYPTDVGLLCDAMQCAIKSAAWLSERLGLGGWRQSQHILDKAINRAYRSVRSKKQRNRHPERLENYLGNCSKYLMRAKETLSQIGDRELDALQKAHHIDLQEFTAKAELLMDQVERRLLRGETIPSKEKMYSVFEPHTRWISKGKAGVSQELGVPVCVIEDHDGFVLHHRIMWEGTDVSHAVPMIAETRELFPELGMCSFDRGFHSPENQKKVGEMLDECALPRKGYLSKAAKEHESQEWFREARRMHPGVESAINHLEHCGADRVRDRGASGFARAVGLSVLSANVKRLGRSLRDQERASLARYKKRRRAA